MKIKPFSHSALHKLWLAAAIFCVLLAVMVTLTRAFVPLLNRYRSVFETGLALFLDQPVQIGQLHVKWYIFEPGIAFSDVVIVSDPKTQSSIKLNQLRVDIDIIDSFFKKRLVLDSIVISGVHLGVRQNSKDQWSIDGVQAVSKGNADNPSKTLVGFAGWLSSQNRISLKNIDIDWHQKDGTLLPISGLTALLTNQGKTHNLKGSFKISQAVSTNMKFKATLEGNEWDKDFQAHIAINVKDFFVGQWITGIQKGSLSDVSGKVNGTIEADWRNGEWHDIQSELQLSNFSINPERLANFKHLAFDQATLHLQWTPQKGTLVLSGNESHMDFGRLFQQPLPLENWSGQISWQKQAEQWAIQAKNIAMANSDGVISGNMTLEIPFKKGTPQIDLSGSMKLTHVANKSAYLPVNVLSPQLRSWLDQAIVSGKEITSDFILRGNLNDFPFDKSNGKFEVSAKLNDITLAYQPNWPAIQHLRADLLFSGRRVEIDANNGEIYGSHIQKIRATIPVLAPNIPAVLTINSAVKTDSADGLKFIRNSPLRNLFNQHLEMNGPLSLVLQLIIPLEQEDIPTKILGMIDLQDNLIKVNAANLDVSQLNGRLRFTEDTLSGSNIQAKIFDKPIQVSIEKSAKSSSTNIKILGRASGEDLQKQWGWPLAGYVSGESAYVANLELSKQSAKKISTLRVISPLDGIVVNLPAPFNKTAEQIKPLVINIPLLQGDEFRFGLNYGNEVTADFALQQIDDDRLLTIKSKNVVGSVTIPEKDPSQRWHFQFEKLILNDIFDKAKSQLKPTDIPAFDFVCDDLSYGMKSFGSVSLKATPQAKGLRIDHLTIDNKFMHVSAEGRWQKIQTGTQTKLNGQMRSTNLAGALSSLGLTNGIASSNAFLGFDVKWPNSPFSPSFKTTSGSMDLLAKEGRIIDIGSEANAEMGFGKLLTLLSVQTLPRRLLLDFSDLTKEGFNFDVMAGSFTLLNGDLITPKIALEGPVAYIELQGKIGMIDEDYDLQMMVVPHITASIPVLATLTGGPIVGAATWMAEKMFSLAVSKMTAHNYSIMGPWKKPEVKQLDRAADGTHFK